MNLMASFGARIPAGSKVLDVGSRIADGQTDTFRSLFAHCKYTGADIQEGPNVDVVLDDPWAWDLPHESYDVVISGNTLEHVAYPWVTMQQIKQVLKPDGWVCIIVPHRWPIHQHPIDCWRFLPDGMAALGEWVGLNLLQDPEIYEVNQDEAHIMAIYQRTV